MEHWFKTEILKHVIDTHVPCQDSFIIGMEIVQRPDKGTIGLCNLDWLSSNMQSSRSISRKLILSWKYRSDWEQGTGDGIWGWSQPCTEFTIPARVKWRKAHWHRSRPSGRSNNFVTHTLVCLYADRFRGTNYGRANLRLEEVALYRYAEANLQLPRSCGCDMVGLNEALIEMETKFQSALQICTVGTELSECANAAMAVLVIRFLKRKMGLGQHQPTIIYQEHQTAIQTMHNAGSISSAYRECQWTLETSLYQQFSFGKLNDAISD